ncbi:MAG: hypothetical protein ACFFDN_05605 [Candidatus Hodarchaeota archaeon]
MYGKQIKDLKLKKKDVLENMEILDRNLKRGAISAAEYFQEFDQQKALLTKIKNKIKELEIKREQDIELAKKEDIKLSKKEDIELVKKEDLVKNEQDQIIELENSIEDKEEKKDISLKEKIKSFLPKGLKFPKMGANSSLSEKEREITKIFTKKPSLDSVTLRELKFFHEKKIELNDHPNLIHLTLRNFLEELGYKIIKMKKPLDEMIELNQEKSRINEYFGYLVGVKKSTLSDSDENLSIFIRHEGICSIFYDGKRVNTQTKTQISIAGNSNTDDDGVLEKDINSIIEKLDSFS